MSDSSKKEEKKEEQTKEVQKGKKKEDEPLAPISAVSTVLFVLKVSLLSLVIVGGVVLFMGWKQLAVVTTSPSALSPLIAQHMGRGTFVPVYIEARSLNVFVSSVGVNNGSEGTKKKCCFGFSLLILFVFSCRNGIVLAQVKFLFGF